ncbi:biotin transporter BioY [Corynebacterium sp. H113]|uniref:biotin transporter BioY n=1 Tax=Corynebacterium sp. H113 TaxID=3133419 RepID=UPI0030AE83B6
MNNSKIRDIAMVATFAALIIVLGGVSIPIGSAGVPIVLQNMGIALAAMLLGWKLGGLSTLLFLGVGLFNVPNMAGWKPLLAALPGPTVGYIVGYAIAAFVVGAIAQTAPRNKPARVGVFVFAGIVGVAIQYLCGAAGLVARVGLTYTDALISNAPYVPGDLLKVVMAALIATAVLQAFPALLPDRENRREAKAVKIAANAQ